MNKIAIIEIISPEYKSNGFMDNYAWLRNLCLSVLFELKVLQRDIALLSEMNIIPMRNI